MQNLAVRVRLTQTVIKYVAIGFVFLNNSMHTVDLSVVEQQLFSYPEGCENESVFQGKVFHGCPRFMNGQMIHETFLQFKNKSRSQIQSHKFVHHFYDSSGERKPVYGHIGLATNPLLTLSVLEPLRDGACSPWFAPVAEVAVSGQRRRCRITVNGGHYVTSTGACVGNIISDGRLAQTANGVQSANFGIRRDGSIVTGYLSDAEVRNRTNPYVQLISGVGWLVRNGDVYTRQSKRVECPVYQEYGSIDQFFSIQAGRTAVGHDQDGRVAVVTIDGKTGRGGMDLHSFAKLLKQLGLVNAINLDGGGTSTFVVNGTITNHPTDNGPGYLTHTRKVSTVICLHDPTPLPFPVQNEGNVSKQSQEYGSFGQSAINETRVQEYVTGSSENQMTLTTMFLNRITRAKSDFWLNILLTALVSSLWLNLFLWKKDRERSK